MIRNKLAGLPRVLIACVAFWAGAQMRAVESGLSASEASVFESSPDALGARVRELRREIARHDELYFKKAAPVISDFEYDQLKAELRRLEASLPATDEQGVADGVSMADTVGDDRGGAVATWRHGAPMLSLEKAYSDEEVNAFDARVSAKLLHDGVACVYRVEPKYDGMAVSLTYEHGRLVRAVTRGNGVEGDDITANARMLRTLPERLKEGGAPWPERIEVRGEIFLSWAEFARINEEREAAGEAVFANPRNLAAGTMRLQDAALVAERRLALVCYGWGVWESAAAKPKTLADFRAAMAAWGLPVVVEARVATGANELRAAVEEMRRAGEAGGFPVDGVVIKLERVADQDALGVGPGAPRWALARKFEPERVATRLRAITWQVGRTGVVTPVAELEPVELAGSTVARATLHNADEISRRDLRIGDRVWVEKAGEIIPALVGVDFAGRPAEVAAYVFPDTCPACAGGLTQEDGKAAWRCDNAACPARVARRIAHFASSSAMDIGGLGPVLIEALVARGLVRTPVDLYRLRAEDLEALPGVGARTAKKLTEAIAVSRGRAARDGARLIYGLGLPGVGRESAGRLAKAFGGLEALAAADAGLLMKSEAEGGPGLGATTATVVVKYLRVETTKAEWAELCAAGVGVAWVTGSAGAGDGALVGEVVVVTGALGRWTRAEASERLVAAGARVGTSVTRETTLVVAGEGAGAKLDAARERGITVIDEAELARRLGEL